MKNFVTTVFYSPYLYHLPLPFTSSIERDKTGQCFADVAEVKNKTTEALSDITKEKVQKYFKQWNWRLDKRINSNGKYFKEH